MADSRRLDDPAANLRKYEKILVDLAKINLTPPGRVRPPGIRLRFFMSNSENSC